MWKIKSKNLNNINIKFFNFSIKFLIIGVSIIFVLIILIKFNNIFSQTISAAFKDIWKKTVKIISKQLWEPIPTDQAGHINILILWAWGENWPWWWLTDTIILASYNPKLGAVTFLSIPRDFYIEDNINWYKGKINALFASVYLKNRKKIGDQAAKDAAAKALIKHIEKITWVPITNYALITFDGFVNFINSIWGVEVCIPEKIVDTRYPTHDGKWTTIKFEPWCQVLNWRDALIYARTRHSTSDFSRAKRQQQIIKWVIKKIFSNGLNISKLKQYYNQYQQMVFTNISLEQTIWLAQFIDNLKYFFSFVYNADCIWDSRKTIEPWCVVYFPERKLFNWLSVILPLGATVNNPDWYKHTQKFANIVIYHQDMLIENAPLEILNGIDRKVLRKKYWYLKPIASEFAKKLKAYAFNVVSVGNYNQYYTGSVMIMQNGTWYIWTHNALEIFVNIDKINYSLTGTNVQIILGNQYEG